MVPYLGAEKKLPHTWQMVPFLGIPFALLLREIIAHF